MVAKTLWLYYLTFSRSILSPPSEAPRNTVVFNDLKNTDDSPFQYLQLENQFNFAGIDASVLYVSPNGALHFNSQQPCYPYNSFGSSGICDFNNSYYGVIGGFLTDLDPSSSINPNISAKYYSDRVKVDYSNIEYFGSNLANSFSVSLFTDDHIEVDYTQISKNATMNLPFQHYWISGIRPHQNSSVYIDSDAESNSLNVWHTKISGFYPSSKSMISTGKSFVLCPVTLFWSLRNGTRSLSELQSTVSSAAGTTIELVTGKLSCVSDIDYGIELSYTNSGVFQSWNINCTANFFHTVNTSSDGYGSLSCPLNSDFVTSLSSYLGASMSKSVNITVLWRSPENGLREWKALPLSMTSLSVISSASVSPSCHYSRDALHGDSCNSISTYSDTPCMGNFSCISTSSCYNAAVPRSLFVQRDCQGKCRSGTKVSTYANTYITDPNNQCCVASAVDCAGYCNGGNRQGYVEAGSTANYCCAAQYPVDCDGVCGGNKVLSCGYCVSSSQTGQCSTVTNTVSLGANNASGVYYFSYITSTRNVVAKTTGLTTSPPSLRAILGSDDSPFATVDLPRPFLFNGRITNRVFVNPNGAVHFSKTQPCYPDNNFASSLTASLCNFDNAYYDLIGGFLTDLNPSSSQCTGVNITMTTFSDHVDFNFVGFCYYYSLPLRNTFTISLYDDDGRVIIHYHSLLKSVALSLPIPGFWLSGIRPPKDNDYVLLDSALRTNSLSTWTTTVAGVYPSSQSQVSSRQAFVMCPTTLVWCLRQSYRNLASMLQSPIVELVTAKLSCVNDVRYGVIYSWSDTSRMASTMFVTCNASVVSSEGGLGRLRCRLPTAELRTRLASSEVVQMHLWVQWQAINATSSAWSALPMAPVSLTVFENTTVGSVVDASCDCNYDGLACGTGRYQQTKRIPLTSNTSYVTATSRNVSYAQSICAGNFTCLNRPCYRSPATATVTVDRLFVDRDCRGNCSTYLYYAQDYMTDSRGSCCAVETDTDCAGLCHLNSTVAYSSDATTKVCCAAGVSIDCAGVCGGSSIVNICGVCTATDPNGNACFSSSQLGITTMYPNDRLGLYPVYNLDAYGTMNTVETITLKNNARQAITITVTATNAGDPLAPALTLPTNETKLNVGESANITLPTSIEALYNGTVSTWSLRTIVIRFYRTSVPSPTYSRVVYLYPLVKSCAHLSTDPTTCMRMPGCFFCLEYPSQYFITTEKIEVRVRRVTSRRRLLSIDGDTTSDSDNDSESLSTEEEEEEDTVQDTAEDTADTEDSSSSRRRLFSNYVPTTLNYLTMNEQSQLQNGYCIDGWRAMQCHIFRSELRKELNVSALPSDKTVHILGASLTSSASSSMLGAFRSGLSIVVIMVFSVLLL